MTSTTRTLVIATTLQRARAMAATVTGPTITASPRSIRAGAVRGIVGITSIAIDAAAFPLPDDVVDELGPTVATRTQGG